MRLALLFGIIGINRCSGREVYGGEGTCENLILSREHLQVPGVLQAAVGGL